MRSSAIEMSRARRGHMAWICGDLVMLLKKGSIPETVAELLEAVFVAELCGCSVRTVRRLADSGRMPRPVKLGSLIRWRRTDVMDWIESGCQPVLPAKAPPR